jgi:hypothetical protein
MKSRRTRTLVVLFAVAHAAWMAMAFVVPLFAGDAPVAFFDLRMFRGYDLAYAEAFMSTVSSAGLSIYRFIQVPLDIVYPVTVGAFFLLLFRPCSRWGLPLLFAPLATVSDLTENVLVFMIMTTGPEAGTVAAASVFTIIKGFAYAVCYGTALYLLIRSAIRRRCGKAPEERTS